MAWSMSTSTATAESSPSRFSTVPTSRPSSLRQSSACDVRPDRSLEQTGRVRSVRLAGRHLSSTPQRETW